MKNIPGIIKAQMEHLGMKQDVLAKELHIARTTVTAYCNGKRQPDLEMLSNICRVLHLDLNWIMEISVDEDNALILQDEFEVKVNALCRKVPKKYHQKMLNTISCCLDVFGDPQNEVEEKDE